jgi:uncharacterized repeat protein (TIGR03803 family)
MSDLVPTILKIETGENHEGASMQSLGSHANRLMSGALAIALALAFALSPLPAQAQTFTVLYSFTGGFDGANPYAPPIVDSAGNLYGTTSAGGSSLWCAIGCGTAFTINSAGDESVLYSFAGDLDGETPLYGPMLRDAGGNLYGTTANGGRNGGGTVFKLNPANHEVIVSLSGVTGPEAPTAGLASDASGNGYGTTSTGGTGCTPYGCGTVFEINRAGKVTVIHSFQGGASDGLTPFAGVIRDSAGNLYGTTFNGGPNNAGTVFKVDTTGKESLLHAFTGSDGSNLFAGLVRDNAGNLYGTTDGGGPTDAGEVFKLDPSGNLTVLYSFCSQSGCADGFAPFGTLIRDGAGNLYGTTLAGGDTFNGTVYKLDTSGELTVLHSFNGTTDGAQVLTGLTFDKAGNLYGTASFGGAYGYGTVYKITP